MVSRRLLSRKSAYPIEPHNSFNNYDEIWYNDVYQFCGARKLLKFQVLKMMVKGDHFEQERLAMASIARDDPSTLPGDMIPSVAPTCTASAMRGKLGSEFET